MLVSDIRGRNTGTCEPFWGEGVSHVGVIDQIPLEFSSVMRCNLCLYIICGDAVPTNEHQQPCCRYALSNYNSISEPE